MPKKRGVRKEEFVHRYRSMEREAKTMEFISVILLFAVMLVAFALLSWFQRGDRSEPAAAGIGTTIFIFAGFVGIGLYSRWRTQRRVRQHGLSCPSCHGTLTGDAGSIAIVCENCAHCGGKLFTEEDGASPSSLSFPPPKSESPSPALERPRTKEEFLLRERAMRGESTPQLILLVLMTGLALVGGVVLPRAKAHPEAGRYLGILFLAVLAGFLAVTFFFASRYKKRTREYGMACPGCQKPLVGLARDLAMITGLCCGCGERLLDDVQLETETNAAQRKEFAERKRAADREFRSSLFIFLPIGALGFVVFIVACMFVPAQGEYHGLPLSNLQDGLIFGSLALVYAGVLLMAWQAKRRRKKYGLICASCRTPLRDGNKQVPPAAKLAVATGRCIRCGGNALAAEEG